MIQATRRVAGAWLAHALAPVATPREGGDGSGTPRSVARVLVVELSRLGDAIQAVRVAARLHETGFARQVAFAVDGAWAPLFDGAPGVDRVLAVRSGGRRLSALAALAREPADAVINVSPSVRNTLVTFLARAPLRAGYLDTTSPLTPFRDPLHVVRFERGAWTRAEIEPGQPLALRAQPVLERLGILGPLPPTRLAALDSAVEWAADWTTGRWGESGRRALVVFHPGATWIYRAWPRERWVDLGRRLAAALGARIAVLGSSSEAVLVAGIATGIGPSAAPAIGEPLTAVAGLIQAARLFVGGDSGPLHLAAALGTRAVALFGPAGPSLTAPAGFDGVALDPRFPCAPCDQRHCVRPTAPCIHAHRVADVEAAAIGLWRSVSGT